MPQMAIEEIESVRGGEKSVWFAGVKGFLLTLVKEAIPSILVGTIAGAVIAGAALAGIRVLDLTDVLKDGAGFLKSGGTLGYIGSVALTSGALSGLLVSAKGAYHEVNHARSINHLIDLEIQSVKSRVHARAQQVGVSGPVVEERPDYLEKIITKGAEASPSSQIGKLLKEREMAEFTSKDATIH